MVDSLVIIQVANFVLARNLLPWGAKTIDVVEDGRRRGPSAFLELKKIILKPVEYTRQVNGSSSVVDPNILRRIDKFLHRDIQFSVKISSSKSSLRQTRTTHRRAVQGRMNARVGK